MQFFIGIVPTEEYQLQLKSFRNQWQQNLIDNVVEPHITLKAQGGLTADKEWLPKIAAICGTVKPFQLSLDKPLFFGKDILYLSVKSEELDALHRQMVHEVSPSNELIKQYFEMDDFVPHLTLAKTTYGLTEQDLQDMAKSSEKELSPFPTFEVRSVRVYQETGMNKYTRFIDIPLTGK